MSSAKKNFSFRLLPLMLLITLLLCCNVAYAVNDSTIYQAYITEQMLTVFTNAGLQPDTLQCTVSNQNTDIMQTGTLADESVFIMTTILVDISTSMPRETRSRVIDTINNMIENKAVNEQYRLVTFGEELVVLQDFTADRFDLAAACGKINFDNRETRIFDALYNTIPNLIPNGDKPAYYRTVVFTDGIDDTAQGITREELFIRLQEDKYPIDVVAVSRSDTTENRELAAIVRISGGRYCALTSDTDALTLTQSLDVSGFFYFRATIPAPLLDGTTRQVDVSDGIYHMSIDLKFPAFNVPLNDNQDDETISDTGINNGSASTSDLQTAPPPAGASPDSELSIATASESKDSNYTIVVIFAAGIAFLITAAIIIAIIVIRGKKKKASGLQGSIKSSDVNSNDSDKTEFISGGSGGSGSSSAEHSVKISSINNPDKTWTLSVGSGLIVGRAAHCHVRLEDKSVSREQCKIVTNSSGLAVKHLGSTNKTLLNGTNVSDISPLKPGDTLKFGREALRIDKIFTPGASSAWTMQSRAPNDGLTEHVFSS